VLCTVLLARYTVFAFPGQMPSIAAVAGQVAAGVCLYALAGLGGGLTLLVSWQQVMTPRYPRTSALRIATASVAVITAVGVALDALG
jgi:hypothetical protein